MTQTDSPPTSPTANGSRWVALTVLCAGMLMVILDQTIVNVALPTIQDDLGFSRSGLAWVVNAYIVAFGGLLLLAGRLGDLVGRRNVLVAGLVVFTASSLLCGIADTPGQLVAARFVQGVGGALASAVILGMIVTLFPEPAERGRAIGAFSFAAAAGGSIGNIAGGLLTEALGWNWVFLVNLPIGVAVVVLALRVVESDRGLGLRAGADVAGGVLGTGGLMLGVYAIVGAGDHGWWTAHTLGLGGLAVALLAGFVARQATARSPLLPLRVLRSRNLTGANAVQALLVAGAFGFMFLSALYMQQVLGYEPAQVGLAILPAALVIGAVSLGLSATLTGRFGARAVLLPGLAVNLSGLLLLRRVPVDGEYLVDLLPAIVLLAFGFGLAMPALTALAMSSATPSDSGLASGLFNTTQQVGGALGLAVLATLAASRTDALLAGGDARAAALTGGYQLAFTVAAGFVLTAIVVAAVVLRRDEPAVADAPSLVVEVDGAVAPALLPGAGSGAPAGVERDGAGASVVVASADGGAAGKGEVAAGPLPAH
jgi:EmrB/QacA subfamily drug resistance transporter